MEEVAGTLRAVGIDPIMAEAAARRQEWGASHRDAVIEALKGHQIRQMEEKL